MPLQKLENADAFVVRDLDTETPAIGIVRSAPKILQSGAKELARSQTYQCAVLGMQVQGASAGVNAPREDPAPAMAAFVGELLPAVESGQLMLDAAKGVTAEHLASFAGADTRSAVRNDVVDGVDNTAHLTAVGAVAAANAVRSLDGAKVAVENFDLVGVAVARAAAARGAKIVAVSTSAGAAFAPDGFDVAGLTTAFTEHGPALIEQICDTQEPFWKILGADADVLFAGSKMGLIDHKGAPNVKAAVLSPTGPIPYTTKAAIMLDRQGIALLPDFVSTAGGMLAGFAASADQTEIEADVTAKIEALVGQIIGGADSAILEACYLAEAFLKTWRDELPFGRPFAA